MNSSLLLQKGKRKQGKNKSAGARFCDFSRERERGHLLSKIPGDRTFEFLRSKKQSGYTQRGLRVGAGFREF